MPSIGCRLDTLQARRLLGGLTVSEVARRSNVSDAVIHRMERGDSCLTHVALRILDALGPTVAITSNSKANPTVITTAADHSFQTGDTVTLAGISGADADPNGLRVVTRINATSFSVSVDCSTSDGTGGTATIDGASAGLARL